MEAPREGNGERNAVKVARCVRRGEHAPAHEVGRFLPYPNVLLEWHGQSERYRPGMGGYACGEPRKPSGKGGPERRRCFSLQAQGEKRPGAAFTGEG